MEWLYGYCTYPINKVSLEVKIGGAAVKYYLFLLLILKIGFLKGFTSVIMTMQAISFYLYFYIDDNYRNTI